MKLKANLFACGTFSLFLSFSLAFCLLAEEIDTKRTPLLHPFLEAEHLFHSGDFEKAQPLYQNFLNGKPGDTRGNTALYRLGFIHQRKRSFVTALRYYKMILRRVPTLELSFNTKFNQAECLFELARYDEAEILFEEIVLSHLDAKIKWEARIYLGRSYEKRHDYQNAIERLRVIYSQSEVKNVRDQAEELIRLIITKKLNKVMLIRLSKKYTSAYPLDEILLRLISIYRDERDLEQLKK